MWPDDSRGAHGGEPDRATDAPEGPPVDPSWGSPRVDGAWLRSANPNSVDGELQNIAAFGSGLTRLRGWRRTAARTVVWLILLGFAITIGYSVVGIVHG